MRVDRSLSASIFGRAWTQYRVCLKEGEASVFYLRRPDDYLGLHALDSRTFPARFFAATHGYFIGIGLLLTFVGLVAALKFAAGGVASPDLAVAKEALNALLAAASFKFMTSIAGLGSSLVLSVAARSTTYLVENAAQGLADDLERAMVPIFTECLAYDQARCHPRLVHQLKEDRRGARCSRGATCRGGRRRRCAPPKPCSLRFLTATFLAEMRGSAGNEMKQLATKLADVGDAVGNMQSHIGHSGQQFADQLGLAASRLLTAAATLQESLDGRVERVGSRIDALVTTFARGDALLSAAAEKAANGLLGGFQGVRCQPPVADR